MRTPSTRGSPTFTPPNRARSAWITSSTSGAGTMVRRIGELLQHSPHGEVEGVDVHGDALERHADMASDERAAFRQRLGGTVDEERLVGKVATTTARVGEQRPDAAVDIDPVIGPGR